MFPLADATDEQLAAWHRLPHDQKYRQTRTCSPGLEVKPKKRKAVLWYNHEVRTFPWGKGGDMGRRMDSCETGYAGRVTVYACSTRALLHGSVPTRLLTYCRWYPADRLIAAIWASATPAHCTVAATSSKARNGLPTTGSARSATRTVRAPQRQGTTERSNGAATVFWHWLCLQALGAINIFVAIFVRI